MSTPPTGHIVARIRQQLAAGHRDEDILQSLTDSGLSRRSAEQFLESTRTSGRAPAVGAAAAAAARFDAVVTTVSPSLGVIHAPATATELGLSAGPSAPSMNASPGRALFAASLMVTLFVVQVWLMHVGYLASRPRRLVSAGLVCVLAFKLAYNAIRRDGPTPWRAVRLAAAVPLVCMVALFGYTAIYPYVQDVRAHRDAERFAVAERSAADRAAADQKRTNDDAVRADRANLDTVRLLVNLKDRQHPILQCDAAIALGRTKRPEHVPVLYDVLRTESDWVKGCAAAGLVALGELYEMAAVYDQWARGDNRELAAAAIGGFGQIGPAAAALALPHLAATLESDDWVRRSHVVDTLTKLGPTARPLLERAARDERPEVREQALDGLDPARVQRRWEAMRR